MKTLKKIWKWIRWEQTGEGRIMRTHKQILATMICLIIPLFMWGTFIYFNDLISFVLALINSLWFHHAYKEWNFNH